jgi:hypothetical protein
VARDAGALVRLQFALQFLALSHLVAGDLAAAAQAMQQERAIAQAARTSPVAYTDMTLAARLGQEASASALIERARREAQARGRDWPLRGRARGGCGGLPARPAGLHPDRRA